VLCLDYNKLKVPVLQILRDEGPLDGNTIAKALSESRQISIDIHALRMALMRYHRQGIVKRTRSGGSFKYAISERGIGRLKWLEEQIAGPRTD
jgi:DNA-binding transcriptional regulator PaaX